MKTLNPTTRPTASTPVARPDRVQQIWAQLSSADRQVILGHSDDVLSGPDRQRFVRIMGAVAAERRGR